MKRAGLVVGVLLATVGAPSADDKPGSEFLTGCALADDMKMCEVQQAQFIKWYPLALKRSYQGQRNVAYCQRTGCDSAVQVDVVNACAWRIVIMASDATLDSSDASNYRIDCAGVGSTGFADATIIAKQLFRKIYKRPMPDVDPPM
ncbi:hypothetical protein GOZ80_06145 [Agrobacterium vitis]|uniref:hypothetical protein n=1 Tax=Agrobacterium vitis TaxID=373 RepID=UPI0012E9723E|nr:hypothetical protein [Agrobacterium vitis]MVA91601.1 hypothetical protein [Agrobacterium vitis]MVB00494.1 hypothetical protein [Agrobacterium vitis]